jgi:hypothetical protein
MIRAGLLITPGIDTRSSAPATICFALVNALTSFRAPHPLAEAIEVRWLQGQVLDNDRWISAFADTITIDTHRTAKQDLSDP